MRTTRYVWGILAMIGLLAVLAGLMPRRAELLEVQARASNPEVAVKLLEAERRRAPQDPEVATRLAGAYERAGAHEPALTLLAAESDRRALTPGERDRVKRVALGLGDPGRALGVLARGQLGPADRRELVALALAAGKPEVALKHQEALLAATPSETRSLEKARDLAIACKAMAKAIRYQGRLAAILGTPESSGRLVALHLQAGDPAGALDALEASPPRGDQAAWHRRAAELAGWAQAPARALPHLFPLYDRAPDRALGLRLARTLALVGDVRALPFARRIYDAEPGDAEAREHLLGLLVRAGRGDAAKGLLLAEWERRPHDAAAHRRLVDWLLATGDQAGASTLLARWVAAHPADRAAMHRLAKAQVWSGRMGEAWTTYARLLADRQAPSEMAWRREWLAISRPVDDAAPEGRENMRVLIAAEADDPAVLRRAAIAAMEVGDRAEAIALGRRLAALPSARGEDALRLAEWLIWDHQFAEGFARLRTLDATSPLPREILQDAADRAGGARRFQDACDFLARLAQRQPRSPEAWEALAAARVAAGDAPGAAKAWKRRLTLPGADASHRLRAAALYLQMKRLAEAEAVLADVASADLSELRLKAALAYELKRPEAQARALEAILAASPRDVEARLALSELLGGRGEWAAARAHEDAAIALSPQDAAMLARIAARRLYGADPGFAAPVIDRLAGLEDPGLDGWRVIADHEHGRDPARAARALDRLHAAGGGDAETYFRRGELASAAGSGGVAEEAYAEAVKRGASGAPEQREAGGYALERLGRGPEAEAAWKALLKAHPARPAAHAALARRAIAQGALERAERLLEAAPEAPAVAVIRAEWLRAAGRDAEAAEAFSALRAADRSPYLAAAEAMARSGAGQHGRARAVVLEALAAGPDPELLAAHRLLRDKGASRAGFTLFTERYAALDRTRIGVGATQRLGDRLRLGTDLSRAAWDGGALSVEQLGLTLEAEAGPITATGHLTVPRGQAPMGGLKLAYARGAVSGHVALDEARWEETSAVAIAGGRERQLSFAAGYQPEPRLALRAEGAIGQLRLPGVAAGLAGTGVAEAVVRPTAASPVFAAYQLRHRAWGEVGPAAGLPTQLTTHAASVGVDAAIGPLRLTVQPGGVYDGTALAAMVSGALAVELGPDRELAINGTWSGRAANVGGAGSYESVGVTGRWWF